MPCERLLSSDIVVTHPLSQTLVSLDLHLKFLSSWCLCRDNSEEVAYGEHQLATFEIQL